jgi:hypothetical protein
MELRYQVEKELADLKNRSGPPPVTPRGGSMQRSPSPPKMPAETKKKAQQQKQPRQQEQQQRSRPQQKTQADKSSGEIYLPEYCPMTLQAVKQNLNHLEQFKRSAIGFFENDLDELGIEKDERGLSDADFKLKMKEIRELRKERASGMPYFNELRNVFSELADKFTQQKMSHSLSLKSSLGNRVTFNKNVLTKSDDYYYDDRQQQNSNKQAPVSSQNSAQNRRQKLNKQNLQNEKYDFYFFNSMCYLSPIFFR